MGAGSRGELAREFEVGDWRARPLAGVIERAGRAIHLEPKIMDVLVRLARSAPEVVTRRELLADVWPDVVVSEEVLTRCISELRSALGDGTLERHYVTTVPKRGYALIAPVSWLSPGSPARRSPALDEAEESVAVLPFADQSPARDFEWFSDGLTDDLIDALARTPGLRVAARTSAFTFKGRALDVREIGERLAVRHVLEGSVRRGSASVRVSVRLASTRDGFQLWSETFERPLADLLALQSELAGAVATRLALHFTDGHGRAAGGTESIEAYDWYLRGRRKYQTERPGFQYAGAAELERAVAIDPRFAAAHGLYAYLHALRAAVDEPYASVAPKVRRSFQAALAVNPLQPEALMAKAIDVRWRTWDWLEVRALFEQALRVAPNDPHVLTHYAVRFFRDLGRLATAEAMLRRAVEIDPLNPTPRASLSYVLRFGGRYGEAAAQAERAVRMNPEHGWALQGCVLALAFDGRFAEAHAALERAERASGPDHLMTLESRARLYVLQGDEGRARAVLARIAELSRAPGGVIYCDAAGWVCLELGEIEEGVRWLTRAIEAGVSASVGARVCALPIERRRPGLTASPAFQGFLRKMRLDDASLAELADAGGLAPPSESSGRSAAPGSDP